LFSHSAYILIILSISRTLWFLLKQLKRLNFIPEHSSPC